MSSADAIEIYCCFLRTPQGARPRLFQEGILSLIQYPSLLLSCRRKLIRFSRGSRAIMRSLNSFPSNQVKGPRSNVRDRRVRDPLAPNSQLFPPCSDSRRRRLVPECCHFYAHLDRVRTNPTNYVCGVFSRIARGALPF